MKEKITVFIEGLLPYDYALFGAVFIFFILFITLALLFRRKIGLSLLFVLFGFATLIIAPPVGYIKLHNYLFKNSITLLSQKHLEFSEAVIVDGSLTNESQKNFKECTITASAYVMSKNKYRNYLKKLKPFQKMSIVEKDILRSQTRKFKIIISPFRHKGDYNISLGADCR